MGVHVERNHALFNWFIFYFIFFIFTMWIYIYKCILYVALCYILHRLNIIYHTLHIYYIRIVSYTHTVFHCVFKTLSTHVLFKYKEKPRGGENPILPPSRKHLWLCISQWPCDLTSFYLSHTQVFTAEPFPRLDSVLALSIEQSQRQHWGLR